MMKHHNEKTQSIASQQKEQHKKLGNTLWGIANDLRGAMNADDFRDYMLSFLFLRYLSHNYEESAKKELGSDYPKLVEEDVVEFEKQMRRRVHYVIQPDHLWSNFYSTDYSLGY